MATIETRSASKRTPVLSEQIQLFAMLASELIDGYGRYPSMTLDGFFEMPEYRRFTLGAYACGFVCRDLAHLNGAPFDLMNSRPHGPLLSCPFNVLRRWVHTMLRSERWNEGLSSPIRDAIASGALAIVVERLINDPSLMLQELVDEGVA